jgi:hypothetical protein
MSRGGNVALLKSVSQAISNYVMSCFQVPVGICHKTKTIIANYWWGFEEGKKDAPSDLGSGWHLQNLWVEWLQGLCSLQ